MGNHETLLTMNTSFDCIISLHTLEHVQDDTNFVESIYSVLKTGGKFLLEVPRLLLKPLESHYGLFMIGNIQIIKLKKF